MAQRISRAKQTIRENGLDFSSLPAGAERTERLRSVLHVLYLIFNEGYTASDGDESSRSVGSASAGEPSSSDCGLATASSSSRVRRDASLRTWSIRRREPTVTSQPRGFSGIPSAGHCTAAASSASWLASSHR